MTYFHKQTEPTLWTVGYEDEGGRWHADSDHGSPEEAGRRVARLNGNAADDSLRAVIKALRDQARWLTMDNDTIDNAIGAAFDRLADSLRDGAGE